MFNKVLMSMSGQPSIGQVVTTDKAQVLCQQAGLPYLVERLQSTPWLYRPWIFDGVSGVPDWIFRFIGDREAVTYYCALPHDLAYAYGEPGNRQERKIADQRFYWDLRNYGGLSKVPAKVCYYAVRLLGRQCFGVSFTWGFADRRVARWSNQPLPWTY